MHRIHGGILQDATVVRRHRGNREARSQALRHFNVRVCNGDCLYGFQPSYRIQMHATNKACTK